MDGRRKRELEVRRRSTRSGEHARKVPQRPNLFELYLRAGVLPAWSERHCKATTRRMWSDQTVKDYGS